MHLERPKPIGKAIKIRTGTRPIKIAYLVPYDETLYNHRIIDALFYESYGRWAGAYTLIIPTNSNGFLHSEYSSWLQFFDPDFVYTYTELDPALVASIDALCSPISFLAHQNKPVNNANDIDDKRLFHPDWGLHFEGISSVTTVPSPQAYRGLFFEPEPEKEITIATQYPDATNTRGFSDNFGTTFSPFAVTYPIPGLFRTLCLVPPGLPQNHSAGSERCTSVLEMLDAISNRKVRTIATFSLTHSEGIPKAEPPQWANTFNLFVGDSLLDRVHFWNARQLTPRHAAILGALIFETEFFQNTDALAKLGEYLNKKNFLGQNGGPANVSLRSYSLEESDLTSIMDRIRRHTYNSVSIGMPLRAPALPDEQALKRSYFSGLNDKTIKLTEDINTVPAEEPAHFVHLPPRFKGLSRGQWIVELDIERHNNLSKYSNVTDTWVLPRRRKIVPSFSTNLGKITRSGRLALLPASPGFQFNFQPNQQAPFYNVSLPTDEVFFRYLLLDGFMYPANDLRKMLTTVPYGDLALSDKGRNLRGVISMFNSLHEAYSILTLKYWRTVLKAGKPESTKRLVFSREQLDSYLPNDRPTKERFRSFLRLEHVGKVFPYMKSSLTDTLEYLITARVFFCIHQWRCSYCGHTNSRNFDRMKIRNNCEICDTPYLTPIDLKWNYQINDFVYRSLVTHTGLPVLWTLGYLQDQAGSDSFWYLPEVDLYERHDDQQSKSEVDILCISGGKFVAVEVKQSASQLLSAPEVADSFVNKMNRLMPDIAIMAFEQYCVEEESVEQCKSRLHQALKDLQQRLASSVKLKSIVATDLEKFGAHSPELGWFGSRTMNAER